MADFDDVANLDSLSLSDTEADDAEDLFASPSTKRTQNSKPPYNHVEANKVAPSRPPDLDEDPTASYDDSLRKELASLRAMNAAVAGITDSLEKAKANMQTVSATVNNASTLLTTWTRILSQTEHNQRLILNSNWHGASQDLVEIDNEESQRKADQERKVAEDEKRARQREVQKEEEERKRALESTKGGRGKSSKYTARGTTRAGGYVGVGGQGGARGTTRGASAGRTSTGIGRGLGGSRGRGRAS